MSKYPNVNQEGAMLALRAVCQPAFCNLATRKKDPWSFVRIAHEFSELHRMARRHAAIQVARCNRPLTKRDETMEKKLRNRIRSKVQELFCFVPVIEFGGDPRGITTRLRWGAPESGAEWPVA